MQQRWLLKGEQLLSEMSTNKVQRGMQACNELLKEIPITVMETIKGCTVEEMSPMCNILREWSGVQLLREGKGNGMGS